MAFPIFEGQGFGKNILFDFLERFSPRSVTSHGHRFFRRDLHGSEAGPPFHLGRIRAGNSDEQKRQDANDSFHRFESFMGSWINGEASSVNNTTMIVSRHS